MKKYLKKTMSITLAGMMLASTVPAVNAASADTSFAQPCVVDYFNSFNGYVKTAGSNIKTPTPDGFDAHTLDGFDYRHRYLASAKTTDDANTYLQFTNVSGDNSGMGMKMDETINSGKLHISFDLKIDNLETFRGFSLGAINASKNNNVNDWFDANDKTAANSVLLLNADKSIKLGTGETNSSCTVDNTFTSWHKYDVIIDLNSDKMKFYLDGTERDEVAYTQDIKVLTFATTAKEGAVNANTNMDNLFIKHYPDGNLGAPEMVVDYAGTAVPSSNATVYVAFSEEVGDRADEVFDDDFAAVNVVTGEEISAKITAKEDGMIKLTFATLPAGKYEIKCNSTYYTGKISGKAATVSNTFSVAGAAQNVKAENVLVSDDFENYNGGMPANAVGLYLDKTHIGGTFEKVDGRNGGNGLKITGYIEPTYGVQFGSAIYKLPYAVTSGKLTYEFDINHTNGMWFTGVLGAECFETDTYSKDTYDVIATASDGAKRRDQLRLRENTVAVGCKSSNVDIAVDNVQSALDKGNGFNNNTADGEKKAWTNVVNGLTLAPGAWNHVKVEIDIDNAVETITVGEGTSAVTKAFKVYENRFRPDIRYKQRKVAGTETWVKTMTAGIQGISLGAFESADNSVTYDNFKVYTDNSYIDYSDFNKKEAETTNDTSGSDGNKNSPPAGWLKQDRNQSTGPNRFYEADGQTKTKDATDYAIQIKQTDLWSHVLSRPIPANTAFEISFDVKSEVPQYNSESPAPRRLWTLSLQKNDQIYTTYENSTTDTTPFESVDGTTKGLSNLTDDKGSTTEQGCAVFGVATDRAQDDSLKNFYLLGAAGERTWLAGIGGENDLKNATVPTIDPAAWHHVSLRVEPKTITYQGKEYNKFKFIACLDNDQSNTFTWTSADACVIHNTDEIHAIGFKNGGTSTTIDNFKVELLDKTPTNVYVTDVNAVSDANGEKTALSSGLAASGQKIEVNFSAPVASADAIKVYKYDGTATTAVTAEKSLSPEKKTATLTLSGIAAGDKLTLEVPNTIAPANNDYLSRVEATAVAFEVKAAADPEIKVEEFRLYKYYAGGMYRVDTANDKTYPSGECWAPATANDVKNATDTDRFKFIAKGYNTGKNESLKFIRAFKDTNLRLRSAIMSDITLENQVGPFAKDTDEFTIKERDGFIGAYLWELSTLKPLYKKFNATLPATPGE